MWKPGKIIFQNLWLIRWWKKSNLKFWLKRVSKTLRKVIICLFLRTLFVFWITQIRDRYFYWLTSPCECLEDSFLWFSRKMDFLKKNAKYFLILRESEVYFWSTVRFSMCREMRIYFFTMNGTENLLSYLNAISWNILWY